MRQGSLQVPYLKQLHSTTVTTKNISYQPFLQYFHHPYCMEYLDFFLRLLAYSYITPLINFPSAFLLSSLKPSLPFFKFLCLYLLLSFLIFLLPASHLLDASNSVVDDDRELRDPISCYICHKPYRKLHFFYHQLCPECAAFNYRCVRQHLVENANPCIVYMYARMCVCEWVDVDAGVSVTVSICLFVRSYG